MPPINDSVQGVLYKDYHNDNAYSLQKGRLVIPCANGAPVVVQVHREFSIRTQSWTAVKERTPPVLPAPADESATTSNVVVLAQTVNIPMPIPMGEGANTYRFAAAGTYQYLEISPTKPSTGYPGSRAPWYGADPALGLAALVGGVGAAAPFTVPVNFGNGIYGWPFTAIGPQFFDPELSEGRPSSGVYSVNILGQG